MKAFIKKMNQHIDDFVVRLERFTVCRLNEITRTNLCLRDTPGEPYPDAQLLNGPLLQGRGRSGAFQYIVTQAFSEYDAEGQTKCFAMRRTLATFDATQQCWSPTPDHLVKKPPASLAARLAAVVAASTAQELTDALSQAGAPYPLADNMKTLYKALAGQVLVIMGAGASKFWHRPTCDQDASQAEAASLHTQVVCAFCSVAATHGTCEHTHTALLASKQLSSTVAVKKAITSGRCLSAQNLASVLASPRQAVETSARPAESSKASTAPPPADRRLSRTLEACGLQHMLASFRAEGVMFTDLVGASPHLSSTQGSYVCEITVSSRGS